MTQESKQYSNGEVTILWQPKLCIHSTKCWNKQGLPEVFHPQKKPWINPEGASSEQIIHQVGKCPSGALSIISTNASANAETSTSVETVLNGPLIVKGEINIKHHQGTTENRSNTTAFCRCGHSANKPFCDGSHHKNKFE